MKAFYQHNFGQFKLFQTPNLWSHYQNYNYILAKESEAWIFDPGEADPILKTIRENKLKPRQIFLTHHHLDHVGATDFLRKKFSCPVMGFSKDQHRLPDLDRVYEEAENIDILGCQGKVLFLPGHTLGLCALYIESLNLLFSNDLIFSLGCGRVFEGTMEQMYSSLAQIATLPEETLLLCSHEYTEGNLNFSLSEFPDDEKLLSIQDSINEKRKNNLPTVPTTLGFEKKHNLFLRVKEVKVRQALKLNDKSDWQVFAELRQRKDRA